MIFPAYSCHGRWEENGTSFLITTPISRAHGSRKFCFMYKEIGPNLVAFSTSSYCNRLIQPGITGDLIFNLTNRGNLKFCANKTQANNSFFPGKCMETNSSIRTRPISISWLIIFAFLVLIIRRSTYAPWIFR